MLSRNLCTCQHRDFVRWSFLNPVQELGNFHHWGSKFSASSQAGLGVHVEVGLSGGVTVPLEGDFLKILLILPLACSLGFSINH